MVLHMNKIGFSLSRSFSCSANEADALPILTYSTSLVEFQSRSFSIVRRVNDFCSAGHAFQFVDTEQTSVL